jgi:hypothetical protein
MPQILAEALLRKVKKYMLRSQKVKKGRYRTYDLWDIPNYKVFIDNLAECVCIT